MSGALVGVALSVVACGDEPGAAPPREPAVAQRARADEDSALFREVAADVGLAFVHSSARSDQFYMPEIVGSGCGLLDYDGDGDLDVYLVQTGSLTSTAGSPGDPPMDRLYRNDLVVGPDGNRTLHFTDVTSESGIRGVGFGMGVATGDYDADGHVDLYVTNVGSNQLWRNRGDGSFEDVTAAAGADDPRWSTSAAFADLDGDGDLDLYVCSYVHYTTDIDPRCESPGGVRDYCGPDGFDPLPDLLLRNRGDGTFEDVSVRSGIASAPGAGLGVVCADLNADGRTDVYVANDGMANHLWSGRADGTFEEVALSAGCALNADGRAEASMGIALGDADEDGDPDLFVSHLTRETNTLYRNDGRGRFSDVSAAARLGMASRSATGFGAAFFDLENDGRLDVAVANGGVKIVEERQRAGDPFPYGQPNQLFRNQGQFTEVSALTGDAFTLPEAGRGLAVGDVDGDGDHDLLVSSAAGPVRLFLNESSAASAWLGVRLLASETPAVDALGVRLGVSRDGGATFTWRRVHTDGSYCSARDPRVLFGLGDHDGEVVLRAVWAAEDVEEWAIAGTRRIVRLVRGTGEPVGR